MGGGGAHVIVIQVTINLGWRVVGDSARDESHVSSLDEDSQPLEDVVDGGALLLPHVPGQLQTQGLDGVDGCWVPSSPGLHCQRNKLYSGSLTLLVTLGQLRVVGMTRCCSSFGCGSD